MIFTVNSKNNVLKIDLSDLFNTINKFRTDELNTKSKVRTEFTIKKIVKNINESIINTKVSIKVMNSIDSLCYGTTYWKLELRWNMIYLNFTIKSGTKKYEYSIPLIKKVSHTCERKLLVLCDYKAKYDDDTLNPTNLERILSSWVLKYVKVRSNGISLNLRFLSFLGIISLLSGLWIAQAVASFM